MADNDNNGLVLKLIICLIAAASAAVVVTVYHCITARYMRPPSQQRPPPPEVQQEISLSMENSVAELLPSRKYEGLGVKEGACSICLCDFEEGEELRTLPECCHSFHVACIDMWLYSHWNCPMCRSAVEVPALSQSPSPSPASPTLMHLLHPTNIRHATTALQIL